MSEHVSLFLWNVTKALEIQRFINNTCKLQFVYTYY
jgi:hypothetical protein